MTSEPSIADIRAQIASMGDPTHYMAQEKRYLAALRRHLAELQRQHTSKLVQEIVNNTPESRIAAAKATVRAFYAQVDEHVAEGDLRAVEAGLSGIAPGSAAGIRIDDLQSLFLVRDRLPDWLRARIEKIYAKINWQTRKGQKGYFNVAVNDNHIPIDKALTILAHLHKIEDGTGRDLEGWIDSVIECGLYPKVKQGKFEYRKRCQDDAHCELCNYLNSSDGLKELLFAYSESAFNRGGHWFGITVAPRTQPEFAKAVGRFLTEADWDRENLESAVYRESFQRRVFHYQEAFDADEGLDWAVGSDIRCFLGAAYFVFGKLVKNGWLDGIRARVENSIEFLPFASHQHWHAVGSSLCEHDPQKMADFIYAEVNATLAKTCPGLYADVLVATISTPEDLGRWIKYITKTVDLVGAVESVYNRHPQLRETDALFEQFYRELQLYPRRSESVFGMIRCPQADERGKHTYQLRHRYVRGTHKFGKGSILSESKRHRLWRERCAERARK
jgi:hypothetical protein